MPATAAQDPAAEGLHCHVVWSCKGGPCPEVRSSLKQQSWKHLCYWQHLPVQLFALGVHVQH
jgi:CDP-diacylglycerol pyrophosphatase